MDGPHQDPDQVARGYRLKHLLRRDTGEKEQAEPLRTGLHSRGYLPHVKAEPATYFVTFRTADSLPKEVYTRLLSVRAERELKAKTLRDTKEQRDATEEAARAFQREIERELNACHGACHLRQPECAEIVAGTLKFFNEERYHLKSWVVMPNHVHALLWPKPPCTLSEILKSWKGFTAREINKLIGKTGDRFWQPETFDRWLRETDEELKYTSYIENNPVKAKLCAAPADWIWSSAHRPSSSVGG